MYLMKIRVLINIFTIIGAIAIYYTCCGFVELYGVSILAIALIGACLVIRPLVLVGIYFGLAEYDFHIVIHILLTAVLFFFACILLQVMRKD